MNRWQSCLIVGAVLLTGCSSTPLELPTCNIPAPPVEVAAGVSVPEMPSAVSQTEDRATFDRAGVVTLTRVLVSAETNKRIATENAAALQARNDEVTALIECSKYQKIWMEVREDMLEQEREDHRVDNLWHRGIIALGIIFAVSQ